MNKKIEDAFDAAFGALQDLELVLAAHYSVTKDSHTLWIKMRVELEYDRLLSIKREADKHLTKEPANAPV